MGNCECAADSSEKEKTCEINCEPSKVEEVKKPEPPAAPTTKNSKTSTTKNTIKESTTRQKAAPKNKNKRPKGALLIDNSKTQSEDNVIFMPSDMLSTNDIDEIKKTFQKHFIFSQLSEEEIDRFVSELRPCKAKKGEYVFKKGDRSGSYYVILEGECQIEINSEKKKILTYGDSFGDLGIVYSAPRSASVLALTKCIFVEMNQKVFRKVMEDINSLCEEENKQFLKVLSFFNDLTEEQKNAIASTCQTETYEEGQIVFSKGDDANSFYVIKEGSVTVQEKNITLEKEQCFGENSILIEGGIRQNTLVAKTKCKLISMSRENMASSLGGNIKITLRKNMMWKILSESELYKSNSNLDWNEAFERIEDVELEKDQILFKEYEEHKNEIYINLNGKLSGESVEYPFNSIIEEAQLISSKKFVLKEQIKAEYSCSIGKLTINFEPKEKAEEIARQEEEFIRANNEKRLSLIDFHVVKKLRSGNFGQVYACYNKKTEKMYAIKVLDREYIEKNQIIQYMMNEEEILRTAPPHPFLVSFNKLIKDDKFIYFIMEYIEGEDLFDTITKIINFNEQQTRFLVSQMLLVLEHLHSHRIIYRDLKPENVMMCTSGYIKLIDMGTAKKLKIEKRFRTTTIIGTPHYMAPEIITGKGYSFQVDLWSLGVIAYELLCGKLPFGEYSEDPFSIYEEIISSSAKYPRSCQKSSKVLIEKLLNRNPHNRMGNGYQELKKISFFDGLNWKALLNKELEAFYILDETFTLTKKDIEKALAIKSNNAADRILADYKEKQID